MSLDPVLLSALLGLFVLVLSTSSFIRRVVFASPPSRSATETDKPELEDEAKTPLQEAGLPYPTPLENFDLASATARNHIYVNKTLRSPYFQTMSHRPMDIDDWIEIDKDWTWYIDEKERIIREQGKNVLDSLPDNDAACGELLALLVDYLPRRYPTLFAALALAPSLTPQSAAVPPWYPGEPAPSVGIVNLVTHEAFPHASSLAGTLALRVVSRLVQDDFLMGRERADGTVYFVGGLVAMPGFYLLSEKIGMTLEQAHEPVPYFNEKMLLSVQRTLKRFAPSAPFERTSWEIVDDRNLFRHSIATNAVLPASLHPSDLWLRVDHQTFLKLPKTRGIIFGVHPICRRLADLADAPLLPALLNSIHAHADPKLMQYKAASKYDARMTEYLDQLHRAQIERGLIRGDENVADFREVLGERPVPATQTSLREPTESERRMQQSDSGATALP